MQLDYHYSFLQLVEPINELLLCLLVLRLKAFLGDRFDVLLIKEGLELFLVILKFNLVA